MTEPTPPTHCIVYTDNDGQLHLIHPSPEWTGTMDELAAQVLASYDEVTDKSAYHIVPRSEIPADRDFRDSWTYTP